MKKKKYRDKVENVKYGVLANKVNNLKEQRKKRRMLPRKGTIENIKDVMNSGVKSNMPQILKQMDPHYTSNRVDIS